MKNNKSLIVGALVMTLLVVSIGYAAITNIALVVSGTAKATSSNENFKVVFTGTPSVDENKTVGETTTATASIDPLDAKKAKINVSGMNAKNDSITVKYPVKNESVDLSAELTADVTGNSNQEYFDVSTQIEDATIAANGSTNLIVKVTLKKTPIDSDELSATLNVGLSARPTQPGV